MNITTINYRSLSYETLAKIVEMANRHGITPEEAVKRWLSGRAKLTERQNKRAS